MHLTGVHYHGGETFFLNTHSFVLTMKILVQSVKAPLKINAAVQYVLSAMGICTPWMLLSWVNKIQCRP